MKTRSTTLANIRALIGARHEISEPHPAIGLLVWPAVVFGSAFILLALGAGQ